MYGVIALAVLCAATSVWYFYHNGCLGGAARYTMHEDEPASEMYTQQLCPRHIWRELLVSVGGAQWLPSEVESRVPMTYGDTFRPREGILYEYPDFEVLSLGTTGSFVLFEVETVGNYGNFTYHFRVHGKTGEIDVVSYTLGLPGWQEYFVIDNEPFTIYSAPGGLAIRPAPFIECNAGPCRAE